MFKNESPFFHSKTRKNIILMKIHIPNTIWFYQDDLKEYSKALFSYLMDFREVKNSTSLNDECEEFAIYELPFEIDEYWYLNKNCSDWTEEMVIMWYNVISQL